MYNVLKKLSEYIYFYKPLTFIMYLSCIYLAFVHLTNNKYTIKGSFDAAT